MKIQSMGRQVDFQELIGLALESSIPSIFYFWGLWLIGVLFSVLAYLALFGVVWGLKQSPKTPGFSIPWVVAQSSLFIAGFFISIYFLRDLLHKLGEVLRPGASPPKGLE